MTYAERFKEILRNTVIGIGIAAVILAVICILTGNWGFMTTLIIFGPIASIIVCSMTKTQGYLSGAVSRIWAGIKGTFFSFAFNSGILFLWGLFKLIVGVVIMIPVLIYMGISYVINLIYLGIMAILEKKGVLESKADLCETLDKIAPILSLVITAVICIIIVKALQ